MLQLEVDVHTMCSISDFGLTPSLRRTKVRCCETAQTLQNPLPAQSCLSSETQHPVKLGSLPSSELVQHVGS